MVEQRRIYSTQTERTIIMDDKRMRFFGSDLILPLSKTKWHFTRSYKFRRCADTNEPIMPFMPAYRQQIFWGLSNAETHEELEEKWLTPKAYLFKKLKGTL